ncbi:MAG: sulfatase, partial [Bacteroidota bacterium]
MNKLIKLSALLAAIGGLLPACTLTNDNTTDPRPNIVFAIMDDATYLHMGAYGCQWVNTPNFDRVAREGLLFQNAYTNNAKCAPSRSIILTGRHSWQLEEASNHWPIFPAKFKVITEVLDEQGYAVGSTGKGWGPGVAYHADSSWRNLMIKTYNEITTTAPTSKISARDYAANFEVFMEEREAGQPFFFWYGGHEPHRAYEYGSGIEKGGKRLDQIKDEDIPSFWPVNDSIKTDLLDYALEIEYFDRHLGRILESLERRGELENTMVVVTADNGMPFPRIKAQMYEYSNHLPLAVMWPGGIKNAGRVVEDFVSFIDLVPTFLEVTDMDASTTGMQAITGRSFVDILQGSEGAPVDPMRRGVVFGKERHDIGRPDNWGYPIRGMIKGEMIYLYNFEVDRWPAGNPETGYLATDGSPTKTVLLNGLNDVEGFPYWQQNFGKRPTEELYNLAEDPSCVNNLVLQEGYQTMATSMRDELFQLLTDQQDPRMLGQG